MFLITIVLAALLVALVVWWLAQVRHGKVTEKPGQAVRKAQRRER